MGRRDDRIARLLAIPGVVRVGIGRKETARKALPDWCFRVHVKRKLPRARLGVEERVPTRIDGIDTDVLVADDCKLAGEDPPLIIPGLMITRYVPGSDLGPGTVAMIVNKDGTNFFLTCDHVLDAANRLFPDALDVYSPRHKSCACRTPVGRLRGVPVQGHEDMDPAPGLRMFNLFEMDGFQFWVDAALAEIPAGVTGINAAPDLGSIQKQTRDLWKAPDMPAFITEPNPGLDNPKYTRTRVQNPTFVVHKRGATTGFTSGVVVELASSQYNENIGVDVFPHQQWEMVVAGTNNPYDKTFELENQGEVDKVVSRMADKPVVATDIGDNKVRLTGNLFCEGGDSGSLVVDDDRKLVGILSFKRGVTTRFKRDGKIVQDTLADGRGTVTYIRPVLASLGLTEADVVDSAIQLAGEGIAVRDDGLDLREVPGLDALVDQARSTAGGQLFVDLVTRHAESIAHMIHHRRRVMVSWHRGKGPAFAAAVISAVRRADGRLPQVIDGVPRAELVARMRAVLAVEGDELLRRDLARYADWMAGVVSHATTIPELLTTLEQAVTPPT